MSDREKEKDKDKDKGGSEKTEKFKKRGSLQRNARMSVRKDSKFALPSFLELATRSGVGDEGVVGGKRGSVVIFGNRKGQQSVRAGTLDQLMELLILGNESSNPDYVETFVATHTYFIDSQTFMTR